jgi:phytoene synthase
MSNNNYLSIYAKSFNWAGFFLPEKIYLRCSSLYDFCRTVDNIVDEENNLHIKKKNLLNFKNDFNNKKYDNPIIKNMWNLISDSEISMKIIEDLFNGVESDLKERVQLNSKKDLLIYSYRVAGTVGLMMALILNVKNRNALKSAIDLGIAMQLTNISRDVVEDKKNNRYYISANFDSIKEVLKLADLFYESSFVSIKEIPFNCRFSILVARRVYRQIGHNILKKKNIENYNSSGKIYVTNVGKIIQTILSISDLIRLSLIKPRDHLRVEEHMIINEEINLNERI